MGELTLRGRCFVGAGIAAVLCGVQLGQVEFVRIGLVTLAVPLLAWALLRVRPPQRSVVRRPEQTRVEVGDSVVVELALGAPHGRVGSWSGTAALVVEERLPPSLGSGRVVEVDAAAASGPVTAAYAVRATRRGRFGLGPALAHRRDPLGMADVARPLSSGPRPDTLLVTPRTEPLPTVPLLGRLAGTGDQRTRELLGGGTPDVTTREYRVGDDLRRVHWPTSARTDTLQVRREEMDWQLRCTLLLDNRRFSMRGPAFEAAVGATASLVRDLSGRGFRVHLVTAAGPVTGLGHAGGAATGGPESAGHDPHASSASLLEQLAVLGPAAEDVLDLSWVRRTPPGGLLVAVVGRLEGADQDRVSRLAAAADAAYAVVHDLGDGEADDLTSRLRRAGWRAATRPPGGALAPVWQELAR